MSLESTILVTGIERIGQTKGKRAQSEIKLTDILKACNNKLTATHQSLEGVLQGEKLKEFPPISEYIEEKSMTDKVQNAIVTGEISQRMGDSSQEAPRIHKGFGENNQRTRRIGKRVPGQIVLTHIRKIQKGVL